MDYSKLKQLEFRRKLFYIGGAKISIFNPTDKSLVGYIKMKVMSLRGEVNIYKDKTMQEPIVRIGGRQVISLRKVYEIYDSQTNQAIAAIRQKSIASLMIRDHMDILDPAGSQIGYIQKPVQYWRSLGAS